jgi:hypothetical protein
VGHKAIVAGFNPPLALSGSLVLAPFEFSLAFSKQTGDVSIGQIGNRKSSGFHINHFLSFVVPTLYQ